MFALPSLHFPPVSLLDFSLVKGPFVKGSLLGGGTGERRERQKERRRQLSIEEIRKQIQVARKEKKREEGKKNKRRKKKKRQVRKGNKKNAARVRSKTSAFSKTELDLNKF